MCVPVTPPPLGRDPLPSCRQHFTQRYNSIIERFHCVLFIILNGLPRFGGHVDFSTKPHLNLKQPDGISDFLAILLRYFVSLTNLHLSCIVVLLDHNVHDRHMLIRIEIILILSRWSYASFDATECYSSI